MMRPELPTAGSVIIDYRDDAEAWHGRIEVDHLVVTRMFSRDTALRVFRAAKMSPVSMARGLMAVMGVFFAFASILSLTPPWTGFLYVLGLAPEVAFTVLLTDVMAVRRLMVEFEFLIIVISMAIFAALIAQSLNDERASVPVMIAIVVTSSQLSDVSLPYYTSSKTDAVFALVGSLACLALYILFQCARGSAALTRTNPWWSNKVWLCERAAATHLYLFRGRIARRFMVQRPVCVRPAPHGCIFSLQAGCGHLGAPGHVY